MAGEVAVRNRCGRCAGGSDAHTWGPGCDLYSAHAPSQKRKPQRVVIVPRIPMAQIGVKPCGCVVAYMSEPRAGRPGPTRAQVNAEVRAWQRDGLRVERVAASEGHRRLLAGCDKHPPTPGTEATRAALPPSPVGTTEGVEQNG